MKYWIRKFRSNYRVSQLIVSVVDPFYQLSKWFVRIIPRHIRPNGKKISYYGVEICFPKDVGIAILNKVYWFRNGYETDIGALLHLLVPRMKCFVDIGSNVGFFSVFAMVEYEAA